MHVMGTEGREHRWITERVQGKKTTHSPIEGKPKYV